MGRRSKLYREYDGEGKLVKLECSKCGVVKDSSEFSKCRSAKDGVATTCKKCNAQYYQDNKEKIIQQVAQYQQDNKEKIVQYQSQYRQDHKKEIAQYKAQYRQDRKKEIAQHNAQYYQDHKEKIVQQAAQYRQDHKEYYTQYKAQYYQDHKEEIDQRNAQYRQDHKEELSQYYAQYRQDHKEEIAQYRQDKIDIEIKRIYKNVTQKLYPNSGVQYGIIYGVHCSESGRWYIGKTQTSFQHRYKGDFFRNKVRELSENSINRQLLDKDVEKYGLAKFEIFEVIDAAFSEKELDEKEAYYIDYYDAYEGGYNGNRGNIFKHNKAKRSEQN